jgi:hypothetical protein
MTKTKPSDITAHLFWVDLPNGRGELHEMYATTDKKAKLLLSDRYIGTKARIRPFAEYRKEQK